MGDKVLDYRDLRLQSRAAYQGISLDYIGNNGRHTGNSLSLWQCIIACSYEDNEQIEEEDLKLHLECSM